MIGQQTLIDTFDSLVRKNKFPRFTILAGKEGSGKTTLAKEIHRIINSYINGIVLEFELPDVKIDTIREMIKQAYAITEPCVYIISNADDMSVAAKNALLKVTEEPPNNAYFIMTLKDTNNTLETIRSRGTIFNLVPYSRQELEEYLATLTIPTNNDKELILQVAETPGDIRALLIYGIQDFYTYVQKVVDNIAVVSGANAFKIANKVALKSDDEGYSMEMFFRIFQHICHQNLINTEDEQEKDIWFSGITITNNHLLNLSIKGANRQFIIDSWILEIRRSWM